MSAPEREPPEPLEPVPPPPADSMQVERVRLDDGRALLLYTWGEA